MKILDRYILITFLKTFFSVFIILMFIFVLQTIWLYITELAGKDLDVLVILKFLWYVSPRLIPLVLPLSVLVTSLMVFGSFAEKYEFAAMKSTGISLQRAMRSLTLFILLLAVTAFFFANNVIPYSEYKWQNLRRNIAQVSPSMVIAEGQFSQIGDNFNIKVEEKSGDRDQFLKNVVIHKKNPSKPNGNYTVIIADNGELASEVDSNTLSLILKDGYYYDEVQNNDPEKQKAKPFIKSYFEQNTINIDLTAFNDTDVDKENDVSNHNMYKMSELFVEIDSLSVGYTKDIQKFADNMYYRSGIAKFQDKKVRKRKSVDIDTLEDVLEIYQKPLQANIANMALNNVRGTLQSIDNKKAEFQIKTKRLNKHEIALHEKYVLAFAVIILFFVGAPLGAIIRKGGMGLPMVVAIVLFLTYHFIGIFAKNSAEDGTMHPFIASWISTVIMLPLGIWLTYRATTDQGIFDIDGFLGRFRKKPEESADLVYENLQQKITISAEEQASLEKLSTAQLKDVVKNFMQFDYRPQFRIAALRKLDEQGITQQQLHVSGELFNKDYVEGQKLVKRFHKFSIYTFIMFGLYLILPILVAFVPMNDETAKVILSGVGLLAVILFYVFLYKTHNSVNQLSKITGDKSFSWLFIAIGMPFYVLMYFYYKKHVQKCLKNIR